MPDLPSLATPDFVVGSLLELVDVVRENRGAVIMAILNTTPDSFFDGGLYDRDVGKRIDQLIDEGADIIDIGAESTRPGAQRVSAQQQIDRAGPAIEYATRCGAFVSIDTCLAPVAQEALSLGARVVNDVSCLADDALAGVAAKYDADLIIMHSRGNMAEMEGFSVYDQNAYQDVVSDVKAEWGIARKRAMQKGLASDRIWFDPGLGFHKNAEQSHTLMGNLRELRESSAGIVLGASRKSFLGALDGTPPEKRLGGSIAACLKGVSDGVEIFRVHDVREVNQALLAYRKWGMCPLPGPARGVA